MTLTTCCPFLCDSGNYPPPAPTLQSASMDGGVTYVARRAGPSTAVAELGSMSTSLRERPPPRPLAPRLPREGRRRSLTRSLSERPRRPDSLDPKAKDRVRQRPGQRQGETRTGTGEIRTGTEETRTGTEETRTGTEETRTGRQRQGDRTGIGETRTGTEETRTRTGRQGQGRPGQGQRRPG
jgi:hypothetical protein